MFGDNSFAAFRTQHLTAREAETRLTDMRTDRRTGLVFVTCTGLLAAWLFFGWLALADQMNLIPETSSQDEHALLQLASSLKPDVPFVEGWFSSAVIAQASASPSLVPTEAVLQIDCTAIQDLPALRLHQRVSIYRI